MLIALIATQTRACPLQTPHTWTGPGRARGSLPCLVSQSTPTKSPWLLVSAGTQAGTRARARVRAQAEADSPRPALPVRGPRRQASSPRGPSLASGRPGCRLLWGLRDTLPSLQRSAGTCVGCETRGTVSSASHPAGAGGAIRMPQDRLFFFKEHCILVTSSTRSVALGHGCESSRVVIITCH